MHIEIAGRRSTTQRPLRNGQGQTVTDKEVITQPTLIYFGYTYCPDVCPLDSARNGEAAVLLEERGVDVGTVFVSIDPERDTPESLAEFTDVMHPEMIGLTGRADSTLARVSTVAIAYGQLREACVNGLAPTTSTTITLAIGDALAVGVSYLMGTAPEDFRRYHPGGKLGTRLLTAADVMKTGESLPVCAEQDGMTEVVVVMSEKSLGTAIVMDGDRATGIITDGDMRRHVTELWSSKAGDIATRTPVRIEADYLVSDAVDLMNEQGIMACLVEDESGALLGLLHLHDCLAKRGA